MDINKHVIKPYKLNRSEIPNGLFFALFRPFYDGFMTVHPPVFALQLKHNKRKEASR